MQLTCSLEDDGIGNATEGVGTTIEGFAFVPLIKRVKAFSGRADAFPAAFSTVFSVLVLVVFFGPAFCFLVGGRSISPSSLLEQNNDGQETIYESKKATK